MRPIIEIINPNSNPAVTAGIDAAVAPLRFADGPEIRCAALAEGPFGIETQAHIDGVAAPLRRRVAGDNSASAFVIACFSDPGLQACREATPKPVFGIGECGFLTALTRGSNFGVIAVAKGSIPRHRRYLKQLGLYSSLAGERSLDMTVAETTEGESTLRRMIAIGERLRDEDGADAIVMGCAGMARHRRPLEEALGVPVIDPTLAAATMALGAVQFATDGRG